MDDISIRLLDILFDLCEGENYVILEKEDLTSRISGYDFAPDELTEILEALAVEGFIDLKYADNQEFCVLMKTKGRAFIKQSRERLQRLIEEDSSAVQTSLLPEGSAEEAPESVRSAGAGAADASRNIEELRRVRREVHRERERVSANAHSYGDAGEDISAVNPLARGYAVRPSTDPEGDAKQWNKKVILAAFAGGAAGALLINLIFLILFLVKFVK